jgi:Ca2+/Na+ antiporter
MLKKILKFGTILTFVSLISRAECQNTGGAKNIGPGIIIILVAIAFSIIWCLVCRASSRPEVYSSIGIIIPLILILVFIFMPKDKDRVKADVETDMNFVTHVVFMVLSIIAFVLAGAFLCVDYAFTEKKAKTIAQSAFITRE